MTQLALPTSAVERERRGNRVEIRLIAAGLLVIAITFGGFGGWSALAPISGAVIVTGSVAVESERKTVQHLEGGIVKEILVKPESIVTEGQALFRLQEVQADATANAIRKQLDADLARVARLEAERSNAARIRLPQELAARAAIPGAAELIEPERKLFDTRRRILSEQVTLLKQEITQIREERWSLQNRRESTEQGISALREHLAMAETLREKNFVTQGRVLEVRAQLADAKAKHDEATAMLAQSSQRITQNELRVASLQQTYLKEATDELRETERRVAELRERQRPTEDTLARQTIVAPIAGEVVNLKVHTVGGVIGPREPLLEIVPTSPVLIIKAKARPEDITHIQLGSEVAVQLTAYKRRTTPVVPGKLIYISADALTDQTAAGPLTYYEVRIRVEKTDLKEGGDLEVSPGMPVEAYIKTEVRTMLEYLVQPVVQSMRRSFREY